MVKIQRELRKRKGGCVVGALEASVTMTCTLLVVVVVVWCKCVVETKMCSINYFKVYY